MKKTTSYKAQYEAAARDLDATKDIVLGLQKRLIESMEREQQLRDLVHKGHATITSLHKAIAEQGMQLAGAQA